NVPKLLIAVLALVVIGGFVAWRFFLSKPEAPDNLVTLSGRIEGDESSVASKASGRIREIRFREGDRVQAGDVVAILDDDQIRAREGQAQAAVIQAEAQVRIAQQQIGVLNEQLRGSQIGVNQARTAAEGQVGEAEARVAAAEADLAQTEAAYKLAVYDRDAYTKLAVTGAVSQRQGKQAETNAETQSALVAATRRRVEAARGTLSAVRANLSNPELRSAESAGIKQQILRAQLEVSAATAETTRARAELEEARANRQDLQIQAPFAGTVTTRSAEPGEVATAGTTIITLIDLNRVYLRGYVAEGQIGSVKIGQRARVYIDSDPGKPLKASVSRIDPQAAFTPENTYFKEDRVKQVVGVKIQLQEGVGFAKPGMPADGEILLQGEFPDGKRRR
ncbi:MAG: HlyD family efflux transporter periplasmic adaptor subunit, partial [Bryobacteraceae bacterium]